MQTQRNLSWIILIISGLAIKIFSFFPYAVERYYANGVYPYISKTQRLIFGWIPFSIGDIFYFIILVYWLYQAFKFFKSVLKKQATKQVITQLLKRVVFACLLIYVLFNLLWGLNYNRLPMARQMNLTLERYSTENLSAILSVIISKLNTFDSTARTYREGLQKKRALFKEAIDAYEKVVIHYPALGYRFSSVKPSMFSYLGNYMGFTGYYNPFSGEAQTNTTVPSFIQPFTTCHEIGHQLGYAKENEASFAGFLAARSSLNPAFQYSVYFEMYSYAMRELYKRDTLRVKEFKKQLHPNVKEDYEAIRRFYLKYENPFEPFIRKLYGHYLKANAQPEGLRSYNEVVAMLVAHSKKYGDI